MRALVKLRLRCTSLFRRRRVETQLDDELRFHFDQLVHENTSAGMPPDEARRSALRSMGKITSIQEECRDMRGTRPIDDFFRDLGYAWRSFNRNPMFFLSAVLILAVGIGVNSAVFTVVRAVVLKPLPFPDPHQLVIFWKADRNDSKRRSGVAPADFLDLQEQVRTCQSIAAFANTFFDVTGVEEPYRVFAARVSSNFFSTLGLHPAVGLDFAADDSQPAAAQAVILSYPLWQRRFNGRPDVIGQKVTLNSELFTIIGVMPPNFVSPEVVGTVGAPELWTSLHLSQDRNERGSGYMRVVARLSPGTSLETVRAELDHLSRQFAASQPRAYGDKLLAVVPLQENVIAGVRPLLLVLWGAVVCVLLITCTNLANMLLVRSTSRIRELAVRASLGAGHWRLTRQLLTENLALAFCGGSLGLALAWAAIRALPTLGLRDFPRMDEVTIDGWVVTFSLALSTLTGLFFGAFPAWKVSRLDPQQSIQHGNRVLGDRGSILRALFVVVQVSLALILVTGAGLLIRSIVALQKADLGFQPQNLLTFELPLSGTKSKAEHATRYYDEVAQRISRLPQVRSVGGISYLPLRGNLFGWGILIQGRDTPPGASLLTAEYRVVSGDLFSALGIRMKAGRGFDDRDNRDAPPVAVINETMARRYWPGEQPVGKQFRLGGPLAMYPWLTVIGMAGDVRYGAVEAAQEPTIYQPLSQVRSGSLSVVVRTSGNPAALAGAIRGQVREIDRSVPMLNVREFDYYVSESFSQRRFVLAMVSGFAGMALFLAAFGIYSVVSYSVTQRTQEIGLRVALGAQQTGILKLILWQGMPAAISGIAVGIAGTFAFAKVIRTLLYGVTPMDPLTIGLVCLLRLLAAVLASYLPAMRALRIDPVVALRLD